MSRAAAESHDWLAHPSLNMYSRDKLMLVCKRCLLAANQTSVGGRNQWCEPSWGGMDIYYIAKMLENTGWKPWTPPWKKVKRERCQACGGTGWVARSEAAS